MLLHQKCLSAVAPNAPDLFALLCVTDLFISECLHSFHERAGVGNSWRQTELVSARTFRSPSSQIDDLWQR